MATHTGNITQSNNVFTGSVIKSNNVLTGSVSKSNNVLTGSVTTQFEAPASGGFNAQAFSTGFNIN